MSPLAKVRSRLRPTVLVTAITVVIAVIGTLVPSATASAATSNEAYIANQVLLRLNYERNLNHLPLLSSNTTLVGTARSHNLQMARWATLSHQLPGEASLGTRITNAGYRWSYAGENVAYNTTETVGGAMFLQNSMYNEPANGGHRLNILSRNFRNVGIDIYMDPVHNIMWLTEDFGTPR